MSIALSQKNIRRRAIDMCQKDGEDWTEISQSREEIFLIWAECSIKAQNEMPDGWLCQNEISIKDEFTAEHAKAMHQHCDGSYKLDWQDFLGAATLSLLVITDNNY